MRIKLIQALRLFPIRICYSADLVRKIRNEFAHQLDMKSFANMPTRMQNVRQRVKEFIPDYPNNSADAERFRDLLWHTTSAVEIYRPSIQLLNKLIRSGDITVILQERFER